MAEQENAHKSRMGRPRKKRLEVDMSNIVPQESHYEDVKDQYLPFSNLIRADQYLKLKRLEYHDNKSIRQIVEDALESYLKKQPSTQTPLPDDVAANLKRYKLPMAYYYKRQDRLDKEKEGNKS